MGAPRSLISSILALTVLATALAAAPPARAEEIQLVSGTRYDASGIELLPGKSPAQGDVRFTFRAGAGSATVTLPYDRIEARSLFGLFLARSNPADAQAQLALARFALARGLLPEATARFKKAAEQDPSLATARDEGLALVRDAEGEKVLTQAEEELRRGRSDLALKRANEILAKAPKESPLAARAAGLRDLASKVVDRDREQREALEAKREAARVDAARAAFDATLARADKAFQSALKDRDRAADPDATATAATKSLESAAALLREGRRLMGTLGDPGPRRAEIEQREGAAFGLVIATMLDLADLYRQQLRFDRARDQLRAAQILDPQNPRIREIRDLVEQDLHAPPTYPPPYEDVWSPGFAYGVGYVGPSYYGGGRVVARPYGGCCGRSGFALGWGGSGWGFMGRW